MNNYKVKSLNDLLKVKETLKKVNPAFEYLKYTVTGRDKDIYSLSPTISAVICKETLEELKTAFKPVSLSYGVTAWSHRKNQKILKVGVGRFNKKTGRYDNSFLPSFRNKVLPVLKSLGYISLVTVRYGVYKQTTKDLIESLGLKVKPTISYMVFLNN